MTQRTRRLSRGDAYVTLASTQQRCSDNSPTTQIRNSRTLISKLPVDRWFYGIIDLAPGRIGFRRDPNAEQLLISQRPAIKVFRFLTCP